MAPLNGPTRARSDHRSKSVTSQPGRKAMHVKWKPAVLVVAVLACLLGTTPAVFAAPPVHAQKATMLYTYDEALSKLGSSEAEAAVKMYIGFIQDPTYHPATANPGVEMPSGLANANTFVNHELDVKPSLFPALRGVNTSVLDHNRKNLWIGTDHGVTRINLKSSKTTEYEAADDALVDDNVLLLISDGGKGVFVITESGVARIYQ
ncbi:hypothetical protein IF188_06755 [Microbacterium sp. NEAU-LLC]|uniref:Uncharacterized protein n=1 Tax=Microbacterium helvum TaxID=2773713 RepID=A0ABR8NQT2_9MICO|nr:hypothetical protein [Microbacterium helvum]MBD3941396.1 hypothetical protein [Microbacterium helvum]